MQGLIWGGPELHPDCAYQPDIWPSALAISIHASWAWLCTQEVGQHNQFGNTMIVLIVWCVNWSKMHLIASVSVASLSLWLVHILCSLTSLYPSIFVASLSLWLVHILCSLTSLCSSVSEASLSCILCSLTSLYSSASVVSLSLLCRRAAALSSAVLVARLALPVS